MLRIERIKWIRNVKKGFYLVRDSLQFWYFRVFYYVSGIFIFKLKLQSDVYFGFFMFMIRYVYISMYVFRNKDIY